jgi:tetratricopeptide (TPR) repeat protein
MRSKSILYGTLLLIVSIFMYSFLNSCITLFYSVFISLAGGGLWFIVTGLFENRKNYNKNLYLTTTLAIIFVVLILIYDQSYSFSNEDMIYPYILGGIFTITTILRFNSFNKWMKSQESVHKILELNSGDTVVLNNNGVKLFEMGQYPEAIICFWKMIEIDPKDAAA